MSKALLHPRMARNLAKMGFYPTDDATLRGIANLLAPGEEAVKLLDPCCGNGDALATLAKSYPFAETYGIELDEGRGNTAKGKLTQVLLGSALDTSVTPQSADLLFLNPPYADALRDRESGEAAERLEHQFLSRFFPALRAGGLLIYIIPKGQVDEGLQKWLVRHFEDLAVFEAATRQFGQVVVTGRKAGGLLNPGKALPGQFARWQSGQEPWPTLPDNRTGRYALDGNARVLRMTSVEVSAEGVADLIRHQPGLWRDFDGYFAGIDHGGAIRPLHDMTDWHTVLLISSGEFSGLVDNGGQTLLVKGRTTKSKVVTQRVDADGLVSTEEHRDRFDTVIKAIDLTRGSAAYGQVITIR